MAGHGAERPVAGRGGRLRRRPPARDVLVLEVKGGRVSHHARAGHWYVLDRNDHKDRIRDPFTQALASAKVLERKVRGAAGQMRLLDEHVLERRDLAGPEDGLGRLFALAHGNAPAAALSHVALLGLLAPDLDTVTGPLARPLRTASATC